MKKRIIIITTAAVLSSTVLSLAESIKLYERENTNYIPIEEFVDKLGGKVSKDNNKIIISTNKGKVEIYEDSSFAKINEQYVALDTTTIGEYTVPKNNKIIKDDEMSYAPVWLFTENKIGQYSLSSEGINIEKTIKQNTNKVKAKPKVKITPKTTPKPNTVKKPQNQEDQNKNDNVNNNENIENKEDENKNNDINNNENTDNADNTDNTENNDVTNNNNENNNTQNIDPVNTTSENISADKNITTNNEQQETTTKN